jgi:hypothetical protein
LQPPPANLLGSSRRQRCQLSSTTLSRLACTAGDRC